MDKLVSNKKFCIDSLGGISNSGGSYGSNWVCLCIGDGFYYVKDSKMWGFWQVCFEYFLEKE